MLFFPNKLLNFFTPFLIAFLAEKTRSFSIARVTIESRSTIRLPSVNTMLVPSMDCVSIFIWCFLNSSQEAVTFIDNFKRSLMLTIYSYKRFSCIMTVATLAGNKISDSFSTLTILRSRPIEK